VSFTQQCIVANDPQQTQTCCPVTDYISALFGTAAAWSPDGHELLVPIYSFVGALGKLPTPGGKTVQGACPPGKYGADLAQLPLHDAALGAVLQTLVPAVQDTSGRPPVQSSGPQAAQVAWSPDGRYLAAQPQAYFGENPVVFFIYDTSTGQVVGTISQAPFLAAIPLNQRGRDQSINVDSFSWSADGRHLLARDTFDHVTLVFGPKSLGLA
jgi:hypothetical protein